MYIVDLIHPVRKFELQTHSIEELSSSLGISKEELEEKNSWLNINDEWYYFKRINQLEKFINELLGTYLANMLGVKTVNYEIAKVDDCYGLLSKNFRQKGKTYVTTYDLDLRLCPNGLSNIEEVRAYFKDDIKYRKFILSLLKSVAIDYYMNQIDRVNENMLFVKNEDSLELANLFDFGLSMNVSLSGMKKMEDEKVRHLYTAFLSLAFPSPEVDELFKKYPEFETYLNTLLGFNMSYFLNQLERNYPLAIPRKVKNDYIEYDTNKKEHIKVLQKRV